MKLDEATKGNLIAEGMVLQGVVGKGIKAVPSRPGLVNNQRIH